MWFVATKPMFKSPNIFIDSFNRANLYYEIVPKGAKEQTLKSIVKFINSMKGKSGIIYTLNRKTTEELANTLQANGITAVAYHAGLEGPLRSQRQDMFLMEDIDVIVATIAFGNILANATLVTKTDSWYMGSNVDGKPRRLLSYIGGVGTYRQKCEDVASQGYAGFEVR